MSKLEEREKKFLDSVGCRDSDEFFTRLDEFQDMMAARNEAAAGLKALLGGRSYEQLKAERRKAALDVSASEQTLEDLAPYRLTPDRLEALNREHRTLARTVDELAT